MMDEHPQLEQSSTYFVADPSSSIEMERLRVLDKRTTHAMGGPLSEQPDLTIFRRVLDIGCGMGGWLFDLAEANPQIEQLVGVDISERMLTYARMQAKDLGLSGRVEFYAQDALRMLELKCQAFDLTNVRFAQGWVRTWEWSKLLNEIKRMTRIGGILRLTEIDIPESSSSSLKALQDLTRSALQQAGNLFDDGTITNHLSDILVKGGIQQIQSRRYITEYRPGTPDFELLRKDTENFFQVALPFFQKWQKVPDSYASLCAEASRDMSQPDFVATTCVVTAWGVMLTSKPPAASFSR